MASEKGTHTQISMTVTLSNQAKASLRVPGSRYVLNNWSIIEMLYYILIKAHTPC